jgi:hypothetical protein
VPGRYCFTKHVGKSIGKSKQVNGYVPERGAGRAGPTGLTGLVSSEARFNLPQAIVTSGIS